MPRPELQRSRGNARERADNAGALERLTTGGPCAQDRSERTARGAGRESVLPDVSPAAACARVEAMWLLQLALTLAVLYAAVVTGMYLAQTWLLFPTALVGAARVQLPASARRLEARTPDGEVLVGVRIPARGEGGESAPGLLGFGGNAWNADAMALYLHDLFPDREVAAFHYRGYAPSTGKPSAEALLSDSVAGLRPRPASERARGCRRRRVQHRLRRGGLCGPAPARRRAGPGHALRLSGGPGPGPLLVGPRRPAPAPPHADHRLRPRFAGADGPRSWRSGTRSCRRGAARPCARRYRTWSSRPPWTRGTTTSTGLHTAQGVRPGPLAGERRRRR